MCCGDHALNNARRMDEAKAQTNAMQLISPFVDEPRVSLSTRESSCKAKIEHALKGLDQEGDHIARGPMLSLSKIAHDRRNINVDLSSSKLFRIMEKIKEHKLRALQKKEEGNWKECHDVLEQVYLLERKIYICDKNSCTLVDIAETLHNLGVARNQLGNTDSALEAFSESLNLQQQDPHHDNLNAVSTINQIAMINKMKNKTDSETEILNLLQVKLAQHQTLGNLTQNISLVLSQFELALENIDGTM